MKSYGRMIPPLLPDGKAGVASVRDSLAVGRLRILDKGSQKAELDDWEDEGGSVTATDPPRLDRDT
jgi:hypothetical protein